ncbi:hypothetical protein FRB97_001984 [Tulasnella sp. 331]|nr:hypothetical protein FRB97_001984 [Tulasnella sp. 331]
MWRINISGSGSTWASVKFCNVSAALGLRKLPSRPDYEGFGWDAISSIYWFNSKPRYFIADAAAVQRICASRTSFPKPTEAYEVFDFFGRSVLTVNGSEWVHHRKITTRAFSEPNMRLVWEETMGVVKDMFDSDWSLRSDVFALSDITDTTTQLTMLAIMAAGFGKQDKWIDDGAPPPGHAITFRQALYGVSRGIITRAILPPWVWGSEASRDSLAVAGLAGRGWLGKGVQDVSVAFSELAAYMREMLREELSSAPDQTTRLGRGNLFENLVAAMGSDIDSVSVGKNDVFGTGFETTAHGLAHALGLLAIHEDEQQRLYDHIEDVLEGGREPASLLYARVSQHILITSLQTFEDVGKLTRVLAVFLETLRLFPAIPESSKYAAEDTTITVQAALSQSGVDSSAIKDGCQTSFLIPKGSEVILDIAGLHYNPRYWPDPHSFKPDRFLDPNWPRDAFLTFAAGSRACVGRRFAEVEAITIMTLIIRRYKVSIDSARFPDIPGESKLQRQESVLKSYMSNVLTPCGISVVLERR